MNEQYHCHHFLSALLWRCSGNIIFASAVAACKLSLPFVVYCNKKLPWLAPPKGCYKHLIWVISCCLLLVSLEWCCCHHCFLGLHAKTIAPPPTHTCTISCCNNELLSHGRAMRLHYHDTVHIVVIVICCNAATVPWLCQRDPVSGWHNSIHAAIFHEILLPSDNLVVEASAIDCYLPFVVCYCCWGMLMHLLLLSFYFDKC